MTLNIYRIAIAMLTEKEIFTYETISYKVKLSNKTIRNNMNAIIDLFLSYQIEIEKNPGIGIQLYGKKENILKCYKFCELNIHKSTQISSDIRQNIISYFLLNGLNKITISSLERKLYITRPSIYNDLKLMNQFFANYNIKISKSRKYGLKIIAGEKRIRRCLLDLTFSMLENDISTYSLSTEVSEYLTEISNASHIKKIKNFINFTARKTDTKITDSDLKRATLFVQIAFCRIKNKKNVSLQEDTIQKVKNVNVRDYLEKELHTLAQSFHIPLCEEEIIYLTAQLSVYLCSDDNYMYRESSNPKLLMYTIHQFTRHIEKFIHIHNTDAFKKNLFPFLEKTMQKFNFDYDFYNPSTDAIMLQFTKLFKIAETMNHFASCNLQTTLPKDAIATITLLLAATQEEQINEINCGFWSQEHPFQQKLFLNSLHNSVPNIKIHILQNENEVLQFQGDFILSTIDFKETKTELIPMPQLINPEFIHLLNDKINDLQQEKRNLFFVQ